MKRKHDNGFPARDAIVAFVRANPGKIGTREIARELGLKNADRVELKRILRELADDGTIAKRGRKILEPAALPPTVMADITGRDSDGELIAVPTEWDEEQSGAPPKIRIHVPRRPQPGTAAGVGFMMVQAQANVSTPTVMTGMIAIGLAGMLIDVLLRNGEALIRRRRGLGA